MSNERTSTLFTTEKALQPLVLGITWGSCALVAAALGWTLPRLQMGVWLACALPALALEASNLHYQRTHPTTTIGMIPVALFSLITPCVAGLCTGQLVPLATIAITTALAALLAMLGVFLFWAYRLRRTYASHPQVSPTAALIVLGGAIKRGRPCETLALRLDEAARLWHECPTLTLVVSGGPTPDDSTTEAAEMAHYLQQQGVDHSAILQEPKARNTRENIALSCALLDQRGHAGQRCVVSSDYHLWRALRDARALGIELTPIAAQTPRASILQQWCREILTILFGR